MNEHFGARMLTAPALIGAAGFTVPGYFAPIIRAYIRRANAPEHIGKQVMVAIPPALIVEWHDKQIVALQVIENELAVASGRRMKDDRRKSVIGVGNAFTTSYGAFVFRHWSFVRS